MVEVICLIKISKKHWKKFKLQNIFSIGTGASIPKKNLISGRTPRISVTSANNGIMGFYDTSANKNARLFKNVISVTFLGNAGPIFYHSYAATFDMKVHSLRLINHDLNKNIALFLIPILKISFNGFNYGNQLSSSDLKHGNIKLLLPTNSSNQPDWQFMNDYISEEMRGYNVPSLSASGINPLSLKNKQWMPFPLIDIVTISSGTRLTKSDMSYGNIPFIGATDSNNGITGFTSNINQSLDINTLGVNYNGSVVDNFYHPYKAIFSDDVKRLHIKNIPHPSPEMYLFLKTVILKQKNKYQYGYKFNSKRMNQQKIMLPIDSNNQPDWKFMENYIKSLPYANLLHKYFIE